MTELTFTILQYGFLLALWIFAWVAVRSLHRDMNALDYTHTNKKKKRLFKKRNESSHSEPSRQSTIPNSNQFSYNAQQSNQPSLLVIIDGALAGTTIPLTGAPITLGRSHTNTIVLNDEFVSSHHARIVLDISRNTWVLEDLNSTNGTLLNGQRIEHVQVLAPRVPVRIGATTFELR